MGEPTAVAERYARRSVGDRYSFFRPEVLLSTQEKQRAILNILAQKFKGKDLSTLKVTEVGCGAGGNLLDFLRFGFSPPNLCGIELLPERASAARTLLPSSLPIIEKDATCVPIVEESQDIVFLSVVFSSLLDDGFQHHLADTMWAWVKVGGGILWYDFIYNNPSNGDVRGVSLKRVKELFPNSLITFKRITLAPPISRLICRLHPNAYHLFNALPFLRTHVLCWIGKNS